jgi:hypothetical protein
MEEDIECFFAEFYDLYLRPCVSCPRKYIEYREEIEQEWKEVRKRHLELMYSNPQQCKEKESYFRLCLNTLRLIRR